MGSGRARVSRRAVLVGGATVVAAASVAGRFALRPPSTPTLERLAGASGPKISVGYLELDTVDWDARPRVRPAGALRAVDLGDAATVGVQGTTPGFDEPLFEHIRLDALYPGPGGDPLPYFAWTFRAEPVSVSPPTRFTAPVGAMSFGFGVRTTAFGGAVRDATSVLTAHEEERLPRFRPGTYLLGLQPGVWDQPARLPASGDRAWSELASVAVTIAPAG